MEWKLSTLPMHNAATPSAAVERVPLMDVIISDELALRPLRGPNSIAEAGAMESLAAMLPTGKKTFLKGLAGIGIRLCNADSVGISVTENTADGKCVFRWQAMAGVVEPYEGGETPRDWSPCGTCLDAGKPMLYAYPERHFTYLQSLQVPIVEALVIPMAEEGPDPATIWIASHDQSRRFDAEDARVMTSLGAFAARSLALPFAPLDFDGEARRDDVWKAYILQAASGDYSGLAALFRETSPLVFAAALRIMGFRADAEEVTADVYVRVWKTAGNYDTGRASAAGWLRMLARSLAIDRLRSKAARTRHETELGSNHLDKADIETDLISNQTHSSILGALQALPFEQRRSVEMAYLSGLSISEIADQTGSPVGTVKTRIRLGLIKLRRLLATIT